MKRFVDLVEACLPHIQEVFPWDMEELLEQKPDVLLVDTREPYEFEPMHIEGSINVPRGILESACDWGYDETVPELAAARERPVVVICRSGNRSALAAYVMQQMGYQQVYSLKTGLRGWNDFELPLVDKDGQPVDIDEAEEFFSPEIRPEQHGPQGA
ncbi:rhodanese-like domain-containing protein [Thiohalobacter sp. IOR34]|uniref:rhodanese-like domain-containing protein n=1 Tax=Thiohalobacter sp. IOR34 TaxID=3057176 RepID=UPI0025AF4C1C|nr:rhodanese-like domain-containing protein [Thiohalobacter sp. IOR34]WJW74357.1 rhodanese-like domain-containing protein [Thiohalobacter sp. IOR34]